MVGAMGSSAALLLASLSALGPRSVPQQIDWQAVEGCPSQAAVREATVTYLGHGLADFPHAVLVDGWVQPSPGGDFRLHLRIEVDGVGEQHELRSFDCDRLGRDAALLIASAIDPFALGPAIAFEPAAPTHRQLLVAPSPVVVVQRPRSRVLAPPAQRDPQVGSEPAVVPELALTPRADAPSPEPRPARRPLVIEGTIGVAGTSFAGVFPQIGGGLAVEGGLERGLFRWQLDASAGFGGQFRAAGTDVGADLWALAGTTGVCVVPAVGQVRFPLCAVGGAGAITASAVNTDAARQLVRPWVYAGADLRVHWSPRPRFAAFLGVSVVPALVRPAWSVTNPAADFRIAPVAGFVRLGVELRGLGRGRGPA
jgi:hypothetical protein